MKDKMVDSKLKTGMVSGAGLLTEASCNQYCL